MALPPVRAAFSLATTQYSIINGSTALTISRDLSSSPASLDHVVLLDHVMSLDHAVSMANDNFSNSLAGPNKAYQTMVESIQKPAVTLTAGDSDSQGCTHG